MIPWIVEKDNSSGGLVSDLKPAPSQTDISIVVPATSTHTGDAKDMQIVHVHTGKRRKRQHRPDDIMVGHSTDLTKHHTGKTSNLDER